jgi:hypothetical protein
MKRQFLCLLPLALIVFIACKKDGHTTTDLRIHLTEAPYNAQQVNVDIQQVRVNMRSDSAGWTDLETNAGIYNLLDFQNGLDTLIAQTTVPTGTVKELRLVLGANNSIMIDSVLYPLTIPSGSASGLKIKVDKRLSPGLDSLVVDFDAALSVVLNGNGDYLLKPVLKIK